MSSKTTINCPNCGVVIDVNEIQYHELEARLKREHQHELDRKRQEYRQHLHALKERERLMNEAQENFEQKLHEATQARLDEERKKLREELKADAQKVLHDQLHAEKQRLSRQVEAEHELQLRQKDEQIEQMKRDIESARRKAMQHSMQTQGEALELAIEGWLASQFPFDTIEEVKKGAFGADCIQRVHTREMKNCGVICYESKNTKAWSDAWIVKLKQDMLRSHADIGVIVSAVYPKGMDRMGFVDGIWVCSLEEFKGSVVLLRESLIRIHQVTQREENRGDKMSLLYNYMTSNEFAMHLQGIVEGFMRMQEELEKEKRSVMASWKRRQKIIDGMLANTTEMYGALQGVMGSSSIVSIDALELPYDED